MTIQIFPLGAGQEVGRSCIIIKIYDKTIMLDCGLHMGYNDDRRFPDFYHLINPGQRLDEVIDCMLLSHFHLDHCGALPYMSEIVGYSGPIIMTAPTRAIVPYMLEDFRRVAMEVRDNKDTKDEKQLETVPKIQFYNADHIAKCVAKFSVINLHQTVEANGLKIKSYYAGHVLGACMFLIEYKNLKVVYTGDFNSNADRHLGAAWIEKVRPDALITETTYADTLRDSKRTRERDFLKQVHETIQNGGKVLIPVFALGRAQELCILLETYWGRIKSKVPVFFAAGMTEKANFYYRLFVNWTNDKIKSSFIKNNMFEFKYIQPFDKALIKSADPMVLFATPGMLHGGLSMQVFKEWVHDEKNLLIIPGYCVEGTLGNKLLKGIKNITLDGKSYDVKMKIRNMSFSAHADAKGILQLIKHVEPKHVVFVHGDKKKMEVLREVVIDSFKLPCHMPANWEWLTLDNPEPTMSISISPKTIIHNPPTNEEKEDDAYIFSHPPKQTFKGCCFQSEKSGEINIMSMDETIVELNTLIKMMAKDNVDRLASHKLETGNCFKIADEYLKNATMMSKGNMTKKANIVLNDIKLRLNEKIKDSMNVSPQEFDTIKALVSFEMYEDFLLTNIDKFDKDDKALEANVMAYLDSLEVIISELTL